MIKAAQYYGVTPWELLKVEGSYGYFHMALTAIEAEGHAEKQQAKRDRRGRR